MKHLTVAEAAARTGLTERAIYDKIKDGSLATHGGRNGIPEDAVTQFIVDRHQAAAAKVEDITRFAEKVRRHVQQPGGTRGTRTQLDKDALKIFGPHILKGAGMRDGAGCRWCWARLTADVRGGLQPLLDDAHRALLGEPCLEDLKAIRQQIFGRRTEPDPTPEPEPARTTAAQMSRAEIRRLAAPTGHKKCGTPVGTFCPCHTSDRHLIASAAKPKPKPKPKPKAKPLRRSGPHPCGCQCPRHRNQP